MGRYFWAVHKATRTTTIIHVFEKDGGEWVSRMGIHKPIPYDEFDVSKYAIKEIKGLSRRTVNAMIREQSETESVEAV